MELDILHYHGLLHALLMEQPARAEALRRVFLAYRQNEAFPELLGSLEADVAAKVRFIVEGWNEIDDPALLDHEVERVLATLETLEAEVPPAPKTKARKTTGRKAAKKRAVKKAAKKAAKKVPTKKTKSKAASKKTKSKAASKKTKSKAASKKTKSKTASKKKSKGVAKQASRAATKTPKKKPAPKKAAKKAKVKAKSKRRSAKA